ncbi:MAG: hypothetical protein GEV13_25520 [Rhodospirillales bacterium]|nr:hypothetical protein [Rhodospirillales bacterium]
MDTHAVRPPWRLVHLPAGMPHYAWANGEIIVQINGTGPFDVKYVDPKDAPNSHSSRGRRTISKPAESAITMNPRVIAGARCSERRCSAVRFFTRRRVPGSGYQGGRNVSEIYASSAAKESAKSERAMAPARADGAESGIAVCDCVPPAASLARYYASGLLSHVGLVVSRPKQRDRGS